MISPVATSTTAPAPGLATPIAIGPVQLATNMLLAPVANYCDLAFRIVCRELGGVGLACTDLLSPQGLLRGTATSLDLARTNDEDKPVGMQLYGGDADILAAGGEWAVRHGATVVDINMGCPVDKVTKKDGGSKLLCDPQRTVEMVRAIVRAVDRASSGRVPVTAKLRLGWDDSCLVAPDLAARLVREGICAITVHGRTTEMRFKGDVRHEGIRDVVEAVRAEDPSVPVIGNGDVTTPELAIAMLESTGCAGVMIGRGSFSRPWIFRRCWEAQVHGTPSPEPDEAEKVAIIRRYFELMRGFRDDKYAMDHIRRRITWFGKALGPCKPMKERVRTAGGPDDVHRALDEFEAGGLRFRVQSEGEHAALAEREARLHSERTMRATAV